MRRANSSRSKRTIIDTHVAAYPIADMPIDEVTAPGIQQHLIYLQTEAISLR